MKCKTKQEIKMKKIIDEIIENGKIVDELNEQYAEFLYSTNDKFHEFYGLVGFLDTGNYAIWSNLPYNKPRVNSFRTSNIKTTYLYKEYILLQTLNSKYLFKKSTLKAMEEGRIF